MLGLTPRALPVSVSVMVCLAAQPTVTAAQGALTDQEKEQFLLTAKVGRRKTLAVGITGSQRVALDDGRMQHDAHLQEINEYKPIYQTAQGTEINFRDYYGFNVAAYRLDRLLGLDMVPVSVKRKVGGKRAAVTWWVDDVQMMEKDRYLKKIDPPDEAAWNDQIYNVRVFNELVYNIDANLGNILITNDWRLRIIDFTRAFRIQKTLRNSDNLVRVDRQVFERLKALNQQTLEERLSEELRDTEINALLARRDLIVKFFDDKIAKEGESAVFCTLPGR